MKNMRKFIVLALSIVIVANITTTYALPEILDGFNMKYDTFKTKLDTCNLCHVPDKPQKATYEAYKIPGRSEKDIHLNSYGMAIKYNLNKDMDQAFNDTEILDSDKDKFTNIEEIRNLTLPGDKRDFPRKNIFRSILKWWLI